MEEIKLSFENDTISFGNADLSFVGDTISFGNVDLSFGSDKLSFDNIAKVKKEVKETRATEATDTQDSRWLTEEEVIRVIDWLKQITSYNLRNDITAYAKEILREVNTASIPYDELTNKLERLKNTFNAVAKRRGRL